MRMQYKVAATVLITLVVAVSATGCTLLDHQPKEGQQVGEMYSADKQVRAYIWRNTSAEHTFTEVWLESKGQIPNLTRVFSAAGSLRVTLRWEGPEKLVIDSEASKIVAYQNFHYVNGSRPDFFTEVNIVLSNMSLPDKPELIKFSHQKED